MPDESTNPVGTAQTPQDNQAVTNQTGDDFVLDFGEGENKEKVESSEAGSHNLEGIEQEAEEEMVSTDIDLNDINLFNEEEEVKNEDNQQNDIKIEDEKEDNLAAEDDFNISLDDNPSQGNNENENVTEQEFSLDSNEVAASESEETDNTENEGIKDGVEEKNIESEEVSNLDYQEEEKIDSNDSTIVEENNLENEENNTDEVQDEGFLLDYDENGDTSSDNEVKNDENTNIDDKEIDPDKENSEIDNEDILNPGDSTENDDIAPVLSDESNGDEENMFLDEGEDNEALESENDETLESENDVDIESKEDSTENEDETKLSDDENDFSYDFQEDPTNDDESETKIEQKNDDMDLGDEKTELEENPVDINLDSTTNDENVAAQEESLSQPEIGDLLGDAPVDFTEEVKDSVAEMQDSETHNEPTDLQEDVDHAPENIDDNQVEKDSSINNDAENEEQSFTLDYQGEETQDDHSNKEINEISNETTEGNKQIEEKSEERPENHVNEMNQANLVNDIVASISNENSKEDVQNLEQKNTNSVQESTDSLAGQQIKSTLSLDQILDSELTNNPQFEDSSKAVPTNVSSNGGASNKKIIGVIACVGLFVLAGVVAVLAFNNKGNTGEDVGIYEIIEEYGTDPSHQAPAQPEEETTGKEATGQNTTAPHVGHTTIQQDFPEVETEEEGDTGTENPELEEPAPYTCEGNECFEEPVTVEEEDKKLDVNSIEPVISSFKSQAEGYYSKGDELQDKKLIRYAAQAISLCESYQEQINNGEGIDEESFESFNSKIKSIISKMENYLGGDTEIQTFTKSNFNEEYDFPGKEEHKEFIYEMANS